MERPKTRRIVSSSEGSGAGAAWGRPERGAAGAEAQDEAEERIRELESWTRSARQRLERAGEKASGAGKSAWEELEGRWSRLQGAVDGLLSRLGGDDS